jgi:hypothetical protein
MTIALLGCVLLSLCAARGAEVAAVSSSLSSTTTTVQVGTEDRTVRAAIKGSEASEEATIYRRELFYRVDDELLKLWNADDDGTSIRFDHVRWSRLPSTTIWRAVESFIQYQKCRHI